MKMFFDALQNQGTEGIGNIKNHYPNGVTAPFAQRSPESIRSVVEAFGYRANMFLGFCCDIF